jgi:hypothetical protein
MSVHAQMQWKRVALRPRHEANQLEENEFKSVCGYLAGSNKVIYFDV